MDWCKPWRFYKQLAGISWAVSKAQNRTNILEAPPHPHFPDHWVHRQQSKTVSLARFSILPSHFLFCRVLFVRFSFANPPLPSCRALPFRLPFALFILSPLSVILYALRPEPCAHVAQSSQFPANSWPGDFSPLPCGWGLSHQSPSFCILSGGFTKGPPWCPAPPVYCRCAAWNFIKDMQPVGYGLSSGHPAHETFRGPLCPPSHCAMSSGDLAGRQDPETFAFDGRTHRCIKFKGV